MPGNEVGDRIHNFLGQESFSQGQHQSQVIDGTWPGLSNNLWVGSQRQVGGPLVSSLKNLSVHQLESDRGHGGQSSSLQHGVYFSQSGLRPDFARSQLQNQSPTANGYIQGHRAFSARQNETNFLGASSRGLSVLDSPTENGPDFHKKNLSRLEPTESPKNYDFFGGQQQISGKHPGMIQSLPRQQSGMTDMQLLQQHAIMQELLRQQLPKPQFHLPEARQLSSTNQVSDSLSPAPINGVPVRDVSNHTWQSEHMTPNANWLQHGASPAVQGSSGGFMFSPEQGQKHLMGLVPQQVDQSFYGISTTGARGNPYQYSSAQMDKPLIQQVPASSNSFPGNQSAMYSDQVGLQDGTLISRQHDQGKNVFGAVAVQGLNSVHSQNLQQMVIQPKNAVMQQSPRRQEHCSPPEASLEKSAVQVSSSQNVAMLDPTEEKILFGSDDSMWDIFGKSTNSGSVLDATDSLGGFPSLQSGSWSALMQSAVAETPSNKIGVQEEWSGLGMQNCEPPNGNMPASTVNDVSKQLSPLTDYNLQKALTLNSKPFPMSMDANINFDFCSVPGVQQSGVQTANEQMRMHNDTPQRSVQQLTDGRSKWLYQSPLQKNAAESAQLLENVAQSPDVQVSARNAAESAQLLENVAQSPDVQVSARSISSPQGIAAYDPRGQIHNKPNSWNFVESASRSGGAISKSQDAESSLQSSQNNDHVGSMYERGHGSALDHPESRNVNSSLGSPEVNREGFDQDNVAAITDSRTTRVTKESSQQLPNSHNLTLWRSIDSKVNSGLSRMPANFKENLDKSPQAFDSSGNNYLDKGLSEANMENLNVKENSNDSFRRNLSHHTSTGGNRENVWLDANDPQGAKQKSSVQVSHKPYGTRNFQYHPMGDLNAEVERSYGTKSVTQMQGIPNVSQGSKVHDQGYFGQSKYTCHAAGESTDTEKGCFQGIQVDEVPSRSSNPGSSCERSFGGFMPNKTASNSKNMLELLQKVDQPREHGTATHLSSSERNQSSEMPDAETSDGSVGQFEYNKPSASQGFGLKLGPPSQRFTIPDRVISSQSSLLGVNSLNSVHVSSEVGRKDRTWLGSTASGQSSTHGASHEDITNNVSSVSGLTGNKCSQYNIQGNVSAGFTSDYSYLKSHLQSQHFIGAGRQMTPNESVNAPFVGLASESKQIDDSSERARTSQLGGKSAPRKRKTAPDDDFSSSETSFPISSTGKQNLAQDSGQQFPVLEAMPASQPSATAESSQHGAYTQMPNVWTSVSAPEHLLGTRFSQASQNLLNPHQQSNINSEKTLPGSEKLDDQIAQAGNSGQSEFPAGFAKPKSFVGEEQPEKAQLGLSENNAIQNPLRMQRDIEAFGRSLRPDSAVCQNDSLLHQVQALRNTEVDPRSVKKFKGPPPDSGLDAQQESSQGAEQLSYGSSTTMRDALVNRTSVPSGDSKMLSSLSNTGDNHETQLSADNMLAFVRNDPQHFFNSNNSAPNIRVEHSQISPEMAPSWFNQCGAIKNGKMLPIYDARKIAMMNATEKASIVGWASDRLPVHSSKQINTVADASLMDKARESSNFMPIASEYISPHSLPPDIANQNLVVRAKKRKSMMFEFLPWHREVTQGSQGPQNISVAEMEWAHAANWLIEKVEDESEMIEDWLPVFRSKRRLVLTTQLMQQLLRAPPRVVLSADASKNYETLTYFVSRSVLGDACSTAYIPESNTAVPPGSGSILSKKLREDRNQLILKAAEEFIIRAKKLENDLQSLDKRASILDLGLECQDLEKVSVINRFAKFHSRVQADGAETSLSSNLSPRKFSQRYVIGIPMPRNLPDRVQCLSL
ncbi:uncharacterized protein LOC105802076 isoform X3 [Gossypium raimondii]|uniref:Regulatory E2 n=2 Tax=Gossypium raimondii TaxID=29730 RepID=A0A0D2QL27_GOSRA|nr:uncharacterized protein LOC105802076 isoform X3 [Gossypium raimondii]XP_052479008.1 uncharacterized protein LOC105802076 isoform X3 [Gossypium raimondii]KJB39958.1 hypothetical protein B456_007G039700 [Gossypium raimondii]